MIKSADGQTLLHRFCYSVGASEQLPVRSIHLRGFHRSVPVAQAQASGRGGDIVTAILDADAMTSLEIESGLAVLIDICLIPVAQALGVGWQQLKQLQYPLCLPTSHPDYPCPGKPATPSHAERMALARIQASIDGVYDLFVATVAKHRKGLDAAAVRATEAGVFMGQAAVDAKLADAVGTLDEVMSDLKAGRVAPGRSAPRLDALGAPASAGSYEERRDRIKSIVTHEDAKACQDLAHHLAFDTDLPLHNALALLAISAETTRANAAAQAAPAASARLGRLMRDPASDAPARNSAAAAGAYTPEQLAARVSGGARI